MRALTDNDKIVLTQKIIEKLQVRLDKLKAIEEMAIAKSLGLNPIKEISKRTKGGPFLIYLKDKPKSDTLEVAKDRSTVVVDNGKESIYCLEGSSSTLEVLLKIVENGGKIGSSALHLLFLWVSHSKPLLVKQEVATRLENAIIQIISKGDQDLQGLAWKILIIGWEIICTSKDKEIEWFKNILETS